MYFIIVRKTSNKKDYLISIQLLSRHLCVMQNRHFHFVRSPPPTCLKSSNRSTCGFLHKIQIKPPNHLKFGFLSYNKYLLPHFSSNTESWGKCVTHCYFRDNFISAHWTNPFLFLAELYQNIYFKQCSITVVV